MLINSMPGTSRISSVADRRTMYSIFLLGFFAIFSTTISKNPVLPLFSQALGAGDAVIGLIAAVSPMAGILFSFPVGVLSDHIGRRRLLIVSGAIFISAPLLYLLIYDPFWLIPVRFFHGMATAILGPVVSAMIAERFPEKKGEMLGQYSSATLIGRTLAPLVGGVLISFFIFYPGLIPYKIVYVAAAIAAIPVVILTFMYREERPGRLAVLPFSAFKTSFVTFFTNWKLRATALVDMATYFAFGAFETFLPLLLLSRGVDAYQTGIIFTVQVLVIALTKPFFGRIADRVDKRVQIVIGLLVLGGSVAALPFGSSFPGFLLVSSGTRPRHVALYCCHRCVRRGYRPERRTGSIYGRPLLHHGYRALGRTARHRGPHRYDKLWHRVPGKFRGRVGRLRIFRGIGEGPDEVNREKITSLSYLLTGKKRRINGFLAVLK